MTFISRTGKLCLFLTLLILAACSVEKKEQMQAGIKDSSESVKANKFFDRVFDEALDRNPMEQSYMGLKNDQDKWGDLSLAHDKKEIEILRTELKKLREQIDFDKLDEQTKLSYQLFVQQAEQQLAYEAYLLYSYPFNQMFGYQSQLPALLINMHQVNSEKDAQAYISRLKGFDKAFDQLLERQKQSVEAGIEPPKFVMGRVLSDAENIISGAPFNDSEKPSTLLKDFSTKVNQLDIAENKKQALIQQAKEAMLASVQPAYEQLMAYMLELEQKASEDAGVWKFPKGEEFYHAQLRKVTTTELTAEEIHQIGLQEVDRIHNEMRQVLEEVGFDGTLREVFLYMRESPQFYYPQTEQGRAAYMDEARAIIDDMRQRLDEVFITKPKAKLKVKAVEAFREKSAGKAFYEQPAPDGSRPGTYYANLYNMKEMPSYQMEALAYHEGIPGHHMQISIAMELENMPKFRKFGRYTAYTEGWGLYSELLPKEMGLYENGYSDFGRLAMELWRACRLVVDTGIHAKKWSREEAIEYYTSNTPNAVGDAVKMVERHIVMPGQATAYKIGMLKILELREQAKAQLGEAFDIREFHEVVLTSGPLPLNILEKNVNKWVSEKAVKS